MKKNIELWATMVTPFTNDNRIDWKGVEELVLWYKNNLVTGIFGVCQSSEMFYLNKEERLSLARDIMMHAEGKIGVVVSGNIEEEINAQVSFLKDMAELKPEALVIVSNRLRKPEDDSKVLFKNTELLLGQLPSDVPLGIYECPYPEKTLLREEELAFLADTGRFAFMKDTCCDEYKLRRRIAIVKNKGMRLYNANTTTFLQSLKLGYDGFCGVMLNMQPRLYRYLADCFETEPETAELLQCFLTLSSMIEGRQYPDCAKYYLKLDGVPITTYSRVNQNREYSELLREEVRHLSRLSKEIERRLGITIAEAEYDS